MANDAKSDKKNTVVASPSIFRPEQIKIFANEVKAEFHKIAWPDKKHTIASTGVVVVLVMVISFYLASVDLVIGKLIGAVLR